MADQTDDPAAEGFAPLPVGGSPPEGALELALQEEQAATDRLTANVTPVVPQGRSYAYDFDARRFVGGDSGPSPILGIDARRQAVEKCVRTVRGEAPVLPDDYGLDADADVLDGAPYDAAAMAELEEATRDAIMALGWVLDVSEWDTLHADGSDEVYVSFRVVPEGDGEPLDIQSLPLVPAER